MFQSLGANLDVVLILLFGALASVGAPSMVRKEGAEAGVQKRVTVLRIAGLLLVACGVGLALIRLLTE